MPGTSLIDCAPHGGISGMAALRELLLVFLPLVALGLSSLGLSVFLLLRRDRTRTALVRFALFGGMFVASGMAAYAVCSRANEVVMTSFGLGAVWVLLLAANAYWRNNQAATADGVAS